MKCPSCGSELPDDADFCAICRTEIARPAPPAPTEAPRVAAQPGPASQPLPGFGAPPPSKSAGAIPPPHLAFKRAAKPESGVGYPGLERERAAKAAAVAAAATDSKGFEAWFARHVRPLLTPERSMHIVVVCLLIVAASILFSWRPWRLHTAPPKSIRVNKIASHIRAMPKAPTETTVTKHTSDEATADSAKASGK